MVKHQIMAYISFVGFFDEPSDPELKTRYPMTFQEIYEGTDSHGDERYRSVSCGFREGLKYECIGGVDSLTAYLATISDGIGHLVADCPQGGWVDDCFVYLDDNGQPIKSEENYNPNPVEQLLN